MGRRTLLLIASVLIAAIGVALIGLYLRGADQRADTRAERIYGPRPAATSTPQPTAPERHSDIAGVGLTVEISDANRAIGLLVPGDYIALYVTSKAGHTTLVVPKVKVISVGPVKTVVAKTTDTVPSDILGIDAPITVAVAIEDAKATGDLIAFVLGERPQIAAGQ